MARGSNDASMAVTGMAWPVQRYCRRDGSNWVQVDDGSGAYTLHLKTGQILLIQGGTILESLSLSNHTQMQGIVRGDTLIVAVRHENAARKFKIRFFSIQATRNCVQYLQFFFSIKDVTKPEENQPVPIGQMYQQLMQTSPVDCLPHPDSLPASFPLEETVHMCILDPSFPQLVARVGVILSKLETHQEASD